MYILCANQSRRFTSGPFSIRRIFPGQSIPSLQDNALGPLSVIDHANLATGTVVAMHEHVNDEILSYMWRGSMVHEDSAGHRTSLSSKKLMMMNAGKSFWHEESTPAEPAEMLQIFIRPREADLEGHVQFMDRPDGIVHDDWTLLAGPAGSNAPLTIRQDVYVSDIMLSHGSRTTPPCVSGMAGWLYIMDGGLAVGEQRLVKGDALAVSDGALPEVVATENSLLICFQVRLDAPAIMDGTISGR
ncbi:pirin family protein [Pantoea dispersa]|uniref:pirin family protein n=1 Tax=Pantoea dispersa TaxID=59814 RepID=UPI0028DECA61|nr:pirin family protein [Pantoea dispersa]MDT8849010.1 pirin family protein [Pantoea dispersa]